MTAMNLCANRPLPFRSARPSGPQRFFSQLGKYLRKWRRRALSRRELMALDDRELRDIGLTRIDAEIEASKPFWAPVISTGLLPANASHLIRAPLDAR
jgi:uncharacterized protein YjiS (DUF1127 family)